METDKELLTQSTTRIKVSSTQTGQGALYGKQNILDGNDDTSWYSNTGKTQYICVFFDNEVSVNDIDITFCGGFGPKELEVGYSDKDLFLEKKPEFIQAKTFDIEDCNKAITLQLDNITNCRTLKIGMKQFYDPYGRVIVYDMKIKGKVNK